jgi:hypothetical protein
LRWFDRSCLLSWLFPTHLKMTFPILPATIARQNLPHPANPHRRCMALKLKKPL